MRHSITTLQRNVVARMENRKERTSDQCVRALAFRGPRMHGPRTSTSTPSTCALGKRTRKMRSVRGAALTEYTVLVGTVALASLAALISLGVALVNALAFDRTFLLSPFP